MKIEREFKPVVITLESLEEIHAFWDVLEGREAKTLPPNQSQKIYNLCQWFSNHVEE